MAFTVPAAATATKFKFEIPRRWLWPKKYSMPFAQHIDGGLRAQLGDTVRGVTQATLEEEQAQRIWSAWLTVLDTYVPSAAAQLTDKQKSAVFAAWLKESNTTLGESSASSTS